MQIRPTKALINLSNLAHNYMVISGRVQPAKIIAVVKADAYGHGAHKIVEKLITLENPPELYAVATVEEVIDLTISFPRAKFLVFEPFNATMIKSIQKYRYEVTVSSFDQLEYIKQAGLQEKLGVHIKIDTGMGRLGFKTDEVDRLLKVLPAINIISIKGVYTHFATSDEPDRMFTGLQIERFEEVLSKFKAAGIETGLVHAANSGGIFDYPQAHFDAVRPGISLYGFYKDEETSTNLGLKPVMSIVGSLSTVKRFAAGESISYGRKFILQKDSWIGSISIGYADGIRRSLSNKICCLINGKKYSQAGTITMDRIMIDLEDDEYPIGQEVVILSDDPKSDTSCWQWCAALDTIPYEITAGISKRVPRVYES